MTVHRVVTTLNLLFVVGSVVWVACELASDLLRRKWRAFKAGADKALARDAEPDDLAPVCGRDAVAPAREPSWVDDDLRMQTEFDRIANAESRLARRLRRIVGRETTR